MSTSLQAGAAVSNITPWLGVPIPGDIGARYAADVDDELCARALVLDNRNTRLAFVTCDLIAMPGKIADAVKARLAERCDLPPENVMINATHTHTGAGIADLLETPESTDYTDWVHLKISDAVELAVQRLQPARIGSASVDEDRIAFNRRWRMKDGTVQMNPGRDNPNLIEPSGPTDPEVAILYVESLDGNPISVAVSYSLHYIGTDNSDAISADYFGHFCRAMQRYIGEPCVPMLWNAASGQINNIDFSGRWVWPDKGHAHAWKMANVLAGHALTEIQLMQMEDAVDLGSALGEFDFVRKEITDDDLRLAEEILSSSAVESDLLAANFSWVLGQSVVTPRKTTYAIECQKLAKLPARMTAPVQALKVGDASVVALPGEIFVETGLDIKARSNGSPLFVLSLANDYIGYVCTDRALTEEGGYETWAALSSLGGVGTEPAMRELAVSLLSRVRS